jgi:putative endonuclease
MAVMFYVYVLKSSKTSSLYIGYTTDLRKRLVAHNSPDRGREYTNRFRPWTLVYYEAYREQQDAQERERKLKNYGAGLGHLRKRLTRSLESAG